MIYRVLRFFFRLALGVFFRRTELSGLENVPRSGPVLFVANHVNALVDPIVFLVHLERPITLTAKSTLARIPGVRFLLKAARVIPLYRQQDVAAGVDLRKNVRSLAECRRCLERGGALCIFPEGQSHSDPHLRPFRTGAARIALDAVAGQGVETPEAGGSRGAASEAEESASPPPLRVVPVGLHFGEKDRFRSDVWVRFGEPIDVAAWKAAHPDGGPRELTAEIEDRVRRVTLNFERRRDSVVINWAADVLATGGMPPPPLGFEAEPFSARVSLVERLLAGYERLKDVRTDEVEALGRRVRAYSSELRRLGIEPREVYISMDAWRAAFFVLREAELLLVGLPMACWGIANHILPALIVRAIARALSTEKDHWASHVVFPGVLVFSIFYALQISAAWLFLAPLWASIYTVILPASGYYALQYGDRAGGTFRRSRTFLLFLFRPDLRRHLAEEGRAIIAEIRRLGEELTRSEARS